MERREWLEQIVRLPVFDTHTHLNAPGVPVTAQTVWDIAHYFWFQEELWSVGYPRNAPELPEDERIGRFVRALDAGRNTAWNRIVRRIFGDLYGVEVHDEESVRRADEAVRARAMDPAWARSVIDRMAVRRITVNHTRDSDLPGLPGVGVAVPIWSELPAWAQRISQSRDPRATGEQAGEAIAAVVRGHSTAGIRGMRVEADPFESGGNRAASAAGSLPAGPVSTAQAELFLTHALLRTLGEHGMFAQMFLGIWRDVGAPRDQRRDAGPRTGAVRTAMAVNDPQRIINLYPLFERYECAFELVMGSPQNNLDAAQPARIFPHVHVGGLWWYNFRPGTYEEAMQARIEAVPAGKSAIVASDARCIEWCYGKVLLVKMLLADFLYEQIERDRIDRDGALWVAREWLHDAPARRYLEERR